MKNQHVIFLFLVPAFCSVLAADWERQALEDAKQDRVVLAYDGVKPDSMVCDTTVREMSDGSWLLFILAGDTREPSPKNFIGVTRSADRGKTWSKLEAFDCGLPRSGKTVGQGPTEIIVTDTETILFFATHGDTYSWGKTWQSWLMRGDTTGRTWGKPERLPGRLGHNCFIRSHIVTHDGRLMVPFQHYLRFPQDDASSYDQDRKLCDPRVGVLISGDKGKTWTEHGNIRLTDDPQYFGWAEPSIVELADGTIKMTIRADRLGGVLEAAESKDGGRTWPACAVKTDIPNPGSKATLFSLGGDTVALVHNPNPKHRSPLALWISFDGMKTWPYRRTLVAESVDGPKGNLNYPEGFVSKDKQWLHVVFDNNRHQACCIAAKLPPLNASVKNAGEHLYNGIVLPEEWPPNDVDTASDEPASVPYLDAPPKVICIDVGRQLFVDEFLIEKTDLLHMYHLPEKYAGNPILSCETALERQSGIIGGTCRPCVWWNPEKQTFYLWYQAGTYFKGTIALATGADGIHWTRPTFDVCPGSNQVLPLGFQPDSYGIAADWEARDPQQRFKLFATHPGPNQPGTSFTSPDGIHWTNQTPTGITGDRSSMFYNPFRKKWVYSLRTAFRGRSRNYWECDDFLRGAKWILSDTTPWLAADRLDAPEPGYKHKTQLYNFDAVAYESVMLGFFELHRGPENDRCERMGLPKLNEISFGYSRDGFHFYRPDRRTHIPASRKDTWDRGFVEGGGNICAVIGDKLYFYHSGCRGNPDGAVRPDGSINGGCMYDPNAVGVSVLRRDGFASLEAGASVGQITTRPVIFSGKRLFVNVDCPHGELKAEVLDENGKPIEPFTLAACVPVSADKTSTPVTWKGVADLSALAGKPVRFRFALRRGSLYAFWVSRDASGRSDGYVAGGGPGYTCNLDTVGTLK